MEDKDKKLLRFVGVFSLFAGTGLHLDYANIADSGLTLSSIVLAVYVAAITGMINTELAKNMAMTVDSHNHEKTQLGTLTSYFKSASCCAVLSIAISSIILLLPDTFEVTLPKHSCQIDLISLIQPFFSITGFVVYVENIVFLCLILKFMLNREIWNK